MILRHHEVEAPTVGPQQFRCQIVPGSGAGVAAKDFEQNMELLERARNLDPANPAILLQLGRSHGLRYNYAAAEECFEKAIQLAQNKTQIMATAGYQSRDFFNPELTERYSRRAAEQKDATVGILVQLADIYERRRRTDEAAKLIDRALQMERDFPPALLTRARLERQAGHLEEAEKLLRSLLPKADQDIRTRGLVISWA